MSRDRAALHCALQTLGRTREQLEPMVRAGSADAQELWEDLEKRRCELESQAKHLSRGTGDVLGETADSVRENVTELRGRYDRLAALLRRPGPESLWGQVRNSLDRLVQGGHRTTERVAGSVEELADAAAVRIKKARLERMRTKKRTELSGSVDSQEGRGPIPPLRRPGRRLHRPPQGTPTGVRAAPGAIGPAPPARGAHRRRRKGGRARPSRAGFRRG